MKRGKKERFFIFAAVGLLALAPFSPQAAAQVSSTEFEALRKTIEGLQQQIHIQGEEIAGLTNRLV